MRKRSLVERWSWTRLLSLFPFLLFSSLFFALLPFFSFFFLPLPPGGEAPTVQSGTALDGWRRSLSALVGQLVATNQGK